jgi:hypothetical protein
LNCNCDKFFRNYTALVRIWSKKVVYIAFSTTRVCNEFSFNNLIFLNIRFIFSTQVDKNFSNKNDSTEISSKKLAKKTNLKPSNKLGNTFRTRISPPSGFSFDVVESSTVIIIYPFSDSLAKIPPQKLLGSMPFILMQLKFQLQ